VTRRSFDHPADVFGGPHVARHAEHVISQLVRELLDPRHVADRYPGTGAQVCLGYRAPNPASRTRDEGKLAFQLSNHLSSCCRYRTTRAG
jgi:hypothetical protein